MLVLKICTYITDLDKIRLANLMENKLFKIMSESSDYSP